MVPPEHAELKRLLEENIRISRENHRLLEKLHRAELWAMAFRILWYAVLIGLPILLYYFVLEPYITAFGLNTEEFRASIQNLSEIFRSASFNNFLTD